MSCRRSDNSRAAAKPDIPAPMIITRGGRNGGDDDDGGVDEVDEGCNLEECGGGSFLSPPDILLFFLLPVFIAISDDFADDG